MTKYYGSLTNRIEENKVFGKEIVVGMGATEFGWSDRHAYEVTRVVDQKHVFIRKVKATRIDENGMSDCQDYKYESDPTAREIELVQRNGGWYEVNEITKELWINRANKMIKDFRTFEVAYNYIRGMSVLTANQKERVEEGKSVKRYNKMDVSFGIQEEYFDYSF